MRILYVYIAMCTILSGLAVWAAYHPLPRRKKLPDRQRDCLTQIPRASPSKGHKEYVPLAPYAPEFRLRGGAYFHSQVSQRPPPAYRYPMLTNAQNCVFW